MSPWVTPWLVVAFLAAWGVIENTRERQWRDVAGWGFVGALCFAAAGVVQALMETRS